VTLTAVQLAVVLVAAFAAGLSKTALSGLGMITVAVLANVLPADESVGAVLLIFMTGDLVAIRKYHAHADWKVLRAMLPALVIGIVAGAGYLALVGESGLRRSIGLLVLGFVLFQAIQQRGRILLTDRALPRPITQAAGIAGGFTSMVANAGGPVLTLYLLNVKSAVMGFLGTNAWLFFTINMIKLPFSIGLGLITQRVLLVALICVPAVLLGSALGYRIAQRIPQRLFQQLILLFTAAAALNLVR